MQLVYLRALCLIKTQTHHQYIYASISRVLETLYTPALWNIDFSFLLAAWSNTNSHPSAFFRLFRVLKRLYMSALWNVDFLYLLATWSNTNSASIAFFSVSNHSIDEFGEETRSQHISALLAASPQFRFFHPRLSLIVRDPTPWRQPNRTNHKLSKKSPKLWQKHAASIHHVTAEIKTA